MAALLIDELDVARPTSAALATAAKQKTGGPSAPASISALGQLMREPAVNTQPLCQLDWSQLSTKRAKLQ